MKQGQARNTKIKAGLKWHKIFIVSLKERASTRIAPTKENEFSFLTLHFENFLTAILIMPF
jgi:hypothetical protein